MKIFYNEYDLVSFIIPVFNRSRIVLETLESIQNQTYQNWECILVDDHSTDKTVEVISSFIKEDNRFQLYIRPNNLIKGANSCRNYGFSKSKGNYIQFFDSDDLLDKDFLKLKIEKFLKFPKSDAVLCSFKFFEKDKWITNEKCKFDNKENLFKNFLLKNKILNTVTFLWKKSLIEKIKFNEKLSRAQDLDYIFKVLTSKKICLEVISKEMVHIRLHQNTITSNYKKGKIEDIDSEVAVRKNILENNPYKEDKKVQSKLAFFYLNTIKNFLIHNHNKSYFKSLIATKNIPLKYKIKLIFIGLYYILTNKGLTKYSYILKPLK